MTHDVNQNYLTDVGAYSQSPSYYGTFDQTGNVWEWNETLIIDRYRSIRGGSCDNPTSITQSSGRGYGFPDFENFNLGFRVASLIPAPSTLVGPVSMALMGALGYAWRRRRRTA